MSVSGQLRRLRKSNFAAQMASPANSTYIEDHNIRTIFQHWPRFILDTDYEAAYIL
jgi:hypothetical protein